jgi:hypothetical protein
MRCITDNDKHIWEFQNETRRYKKEKILFKEIVVAKFPNLEK